MHITCMYYTLRRWHYTCVDLQAIIANGFTLPEDYDYNGVLYLEGFGFYADEDPLSQGFYLDEVSFSHSARNLNTTVCDTHEKLHLHLNFFSIPGLRPSCSSQWTHY